MRYVYVLKSEVDNTLYIGQTGNLEKRLKEHNRGKTKSIRSKIPYRLIYFEETMSMLEARTKELHFKKSFMREKFRKI